MPPGCIAPFLCVFAGIWLGFPNDFLEIPCLVLLWPTGLAMLGVLAKNYRQAFVLGWLAQCAGSLAALYWLSFPVHYVGGLPWPAALACAFLICLCLSLQGGAISALCHWTKRANLLVWSILTGLCWYLLEFLCAKLFGFPWLQVAGALAPWPILTQGADLLGAWLWSSLWIIAALLLAGALPLLPGSRRPVISGILAGCCVLALLAYGWQKLRDYPFNAHPQGQGTMNVLFVEGNIDQNQKWLPEFQCLSLDRYLDLTREGLRASEREGYDRPLIIWPETAMPFFFEKTPSLASLVVQCARQSDCPLLFGAPGVARMPGLPEEAVFNRAFLLDPSGKLLGFYDKEHLVPFGEYLPEWLNFKFLESLLQGVGIYQEGRETAPLRYGPLALGVLICYEGIFPWIAGERIAEGANLLVDISNDGWFGNSPASRQHLYLTVLRCIEQNRWLLRGTNTGISAICDNRGRLTLKGPQYRAEYLVGSASLVGENSLYQRLAPYLPWAVLLAVCGLATGHVFFAAKQKRI